ncbi:MAG: class I SAM-dependent methyltransferase [Alphaproteobacteria bacterium]|nr:class I SAM-dependent methyltransferase [Alphaproteobacteria bacterium]
MDQAEYIKMYEAEDRMWWYHGVHANVAALLAGAGAGGAVLDAGCGTGGLLAKLQRLLPRLGPSMGLDYDPIAAAFARRKSGAPICVATVNRLPFRDGAFGVVLSVDVLAHDGVDEAQALREAHRCLVPGGALLVNLPAYQWLRGAHDERVHQHRRYTRPRVIALLRAAGFERVRATYWNTVLFPLMVLRRKVFPPRDAASDVMIYPRPVERLFRAFVALENWWLRLGFALPFGGSVMAVAVKSAQGTAATQGVSHHG